MRRITPLHFFEIFFIFTVNTLCKTIAFAFNGIGIGGVLPARVPSKVPRFFSTSNVNSFISTGAPILSTPSSAYFDSFAGKVEQKLIDTFDTNSIHRIIQSWRLLDSGYEHRQQFLSSSSSSSQNNNNDDESNNSFLQHAHSYVPGLTVQKFWDIQSIPWCQRLSSYYQEIREELVRVTSDMETLKSQGSSNVWAGPLTQDASSYGKGWRTLGLYEKGVWDGPNVRMFPITAKAIQDSNVPLVEAFFASMEPQSKIKMHSDFTNFVLTVHLPLVIPQNGKNKCRLTIGDETRQWVNGQLMMFDTSLMHDAINETDETRYILMFRVWHPDLSQVEREALQLLFDCLRLPELVSSNPSERFLAEQHLQLLKSFPDIVPPPPPSSASTTTTSNDNKSIELFTSRTSSSKTKKNKVTRGTSGGKGFGKG